MSDNEILVSTVEFDDLLAAKKIVVSKADLGALLAAKDSLRLEVERLRLTDAEREAMSRAYDVLYERAGQLQASGNIAASTPFVQSAKALQGLWARLGVGA